MIETSVLASFFCNLHIYMAPCLETKIQRHLRKNLHSLSMVGNKKSTNTNLRRTN